MKNSSIQYIKGDATCPQAAGIKIIAHICNDRGGWGKGFVLAISRRWDKPEKEYRAWYRKGNFTLGITQFVQAEKYIWVANMLAQHGFHGQAVRYDALEKCLCAVREKAKALDASVHMPRIGCGLGGGSWTAIEPIVVKTLYDVPVIVYDYS